MLCCTPDNEARSRILHPSINSGIVGNARTDSCRDDRSERFFQRSEAPKKRRLAGGDISLLPRGTFPVLYQGDLEMMIKIRIHVANWWKKKIKKI
jgi:hypothetical protein